MTREERIHHLSCLINDRAAAGLDVTDLELQREHLYRKRPKMTYSGRDPLKEALINMREIE